jgi:hypothetical protein
LKEVVVEFKRDNLAAARSEDRTDSIWLETPLTIHKDSDNHGSEHLRIYLIFTTSFSVTVRQRIL